MRSAHPLSNRFNKALSLAFDLHREQRRKGTDIPYLSHLLAVASLVLEHGGTEDEAIAALLHDGPEDQGGVETLDRIKEEFGAEVATIVRDCSDTFEQPKPPWRQRKESYIRHLEDVGPSTLLVSMADKTHNLERIVEDWKVDGDQLWDRFRALSESEKAGLNPEQILGKKRAHVAWYYGELLHVYRTRCERRSKPLLARLDAAHQTIAL